MTAMNELTERRAGARIRTRPDLLPPRIVARRQDLLRQGLWRRRRPPPVRRRGGGGRVSRPARGRDRLPRQGRAQRGFHRAPPWVAGWSRAEWTGSARAWTCRRRQRYPPVSCAKVAAVDSATNNWLRLAAYELETARAMVAAERTLYVIIACQQACEKAIKAVISSARPRSLRGATIWSSSLGPPRSSCRSPTPSGSRISTSRSWWCGIRPTWRRRSERSRCRLCSR